MRREIAIKLNEKAEEVAQRYSNPDREFNHNREEFKVHRICPLSEFTAIVVFLKNTGKRALAYFYCVPSKEYWGYFFINSGHLAGLSNKAMQIYQETEEYNFKFNIREVRQ